MSATELRKVSVSNYISRSIVVPLVHSKESPDSGVTSLTYTYHTRENKE